MFIITHTEIGEGSAVIIEIEGPLNSESSPDFDDYIWKLIDNNILYILIDMGKLSFISSEGIGAVLLIQKNIHEKNGLIIFYDLNYEVSSLFKLLGFDKVFTIAEDRANALQILDRHMELHPSVTDKYPHSDGIEVQHEEIQPEEVQIKVAGINEELTDFIEEENGFEHVFDEPPADISFSMEEEKEEEKFKPFVIECLKCKSLIRVKEQGDQMCPFCNTEFTVTDENKAEFMLTDSTM